MRLGHAASTDLIRGVAPDRAHRGPPRRTPLRGSPSRTLGTAAVDDEVVVRAPGRRISWPADVVDAAAQCDINWSTISTIAVLQLRMGHGAVVLRFREVERRFRL